MKKNNNKRYDETHVFESRFDVFAMDFNWFKKEDEIQINSFVIATRTIIPLYFFSSKAHFLAFKFKTKSILMLRVACFWLIIVINFSNSIYKKNNFFYNHNENGYIAN